MTTGDAGMMLERPAQDWPVTLVSRDGRTPALVLRALRQGDRSAWDRVRNANLHYVGQWEPTAPDGVGRRITFRKYVRSLDREARSGRIVPFLIEADGQIAGQMHLFGIVHGSLLSGAAGYWVAEQYAGQGVATRALAMLCDYAFGTLGLHRIEVNVRPENGPSLRVVEHLRFRDEGIRERYLHINGGWRDHRTFALTSDDIQSGRTLDRWTRARQP
ncbi:MAG: GNAT family protein [Lapillicoccus sp.]